MFEGVDSNQHPRFHWVAMNIFTFHKWLCMHLPMKFSWDATESHQCSSYADLRSANVLDPQNGKHLELREVSSVDRSVCSQEIDPQVHRLFSLNFSFLELRTRRAFATQNHPKRQASLPKGRKKQGQAMVLPFPELRKISNSWSLSEPLQSAATATFQVVDLLTHPRFRARRLAKEDWMFQNIWVWVKTLVPSEPQNSW